MKILYVFFSLSILMLTFPAFSLGQGRVVMAKSSQNSPDDPRGLIVYQEQIKRLKTSAERFQGGTDGLYKGGISPTEWAYRAVSMNARNAFLEKIGTNMSQNLKDQLSRDLDDLKSTLAPKIVLLKPDPAGFAFSSTALEGMMRKELKTNVIAHRFGMYSADWLVTRTPIGTPEYRARNGAVYIRNKDADFPFCEVLTFRFRQDWNGTGFGATQISLDGSYLCACP